MSTIETSGRNTVTVNGVEYERDGQQTRFITSAATVGPTNAGGRVFPSGFTIYTVRNGVIDNGRFVRLDR